MTGNNPLTKIAGAAALALALAAGALPAQAAGPSFGFSFGFGTSPRFQERVVCLSDYQVRQAIAARGYSRIYLNAGDGKYIQVKANRDGRTWLIKFNRCADRIVERSRLR